MDAIFLLLILFTAAYGLIAFKKNLQLVGKRFTALWVQKNYKDRRFLMQKIANSGKIATSFGRKKAPRWKGFWGLKFLCTSFQCVKSISKQFRPLETILCFSRGSRKKEKGHQQPLSETDANWTQSSLFFANNFHFKSFLAFFTFNRVCITNSTKWIVEICVSSRNTDC